MALVCIHCSLRALVKGEQVPTFDEEPMIHMQRLHSNMEETNRERQEMEVQLERMAREGKLPFPSERKNGDDIG